mmetsp:Transcript_29775/g.72109  ORF Transcript_29775/g.72109 Transcript_29775/m.72109 type:complete len:751 (-) Transcript_29775:32-2284(-)
MPSSETILQSQSQALDDTDPYASIWKNILDRQRRQQQDQDFGTTVIGNYDDGDDDDDDDRKNGQKNNKNKKLYRLWGGRGKGGRGLSRRTVQPTTIVIDDIRLHYLQDGRTRTATKNNDKKRTPGPGGKKGGQRMLLDGATLKLLHGHRYALIGRNGSGKSTLLQRIHEQKLPGWSIQWSSLYVPPFMSLEDQSSTPIELFQQKLDECQRRSRSAIESRGQELETQLDDVDVQEDPEAAEKLCEQISTLEDQFEPTDDQQFKAFHRLVQDDLRIDTQRPCKLLSAEQQKEVLLISAFLCSQYTTLLLLDEPTTNLSIPGLLRLRQMFESITSCTVVMITHDLDLINDVATDIIELKAMKLSYYPGNYDSYRLMKEQMETHHMKQALVVEKKRDQLKNTLQSLKEKPTPKRGGAKKKAKSIAAHRKKIEWHEKDASEVLSSTDCTILPERKGLTAAERIRLSQIFKSVPDKAVQFVFPTIPSQWGEPLVVAYDVAYRDPNETSSSDIMTEELLTRDEEGIVSTSNDQTNENLVFQVVKCDGFCFDCVDICIEENSLNCILGPTELSSYLLKILAKRLSPTEGTVHHASGINIGFIDSVIMEQFKNELESTTMTALEYLSKICTGKSQEELRAYLTSFGMSSDSQTKTPACCLSGGETFRFVLAAQMIDKPPVLFLDSPTSHLDVDSVHALSYALQKWNGTLVMVCHDASFLRSLDQVKCVVIVPEEGKVRRIVQEEGSGSIDSYLNSFHNN